jgi:hypothetical protein
MARAIEPIRRMWPLQRERRQARDATPAEPPVVNVTINVGTEASPPAQLVAGPAPSLDAHMIAQSARARGLRGGHKLLATARAVYLGVQWSGPNDRRIPAGRITKTEA